MKKYLFNELLSRMCTRIHLPPRPQPFRLNEARQAGSMIRRKGFFLVFQLAKAKNCFFIRLQSIRFIIVIHKKESALLALF